MPPSPAPPSAPGPAAAPVTVFATARSWIESDAVDQCHQVAALPGMVRVAAMPDLHPGQAAPIGAAMLSAELYPHLVGSDIGCGIAVFPLALRRIDPERLARRFPDLDRPSGPDGLGTVGRGNHFAELARVDTVSDPVAAARLGLAAGSVVLIVHTGSRGTGEAILRAHVDAHGHGPAPDHAAYLVDHDRAVAWAAANRRAVAERVAEALAARLGEPVIDLCHNHVEPRRPSLAAEGAHVHAPVHDGNPPLYLHRKGAAPGDGRPVLVAGSQGTPSWVVDGHAGAEANWSVAHGAGRKLSRRDAYERNRARHTVAELRRTPLGSVVVCGDRQLLFEEAPDAYKPITRVIADLAELGLATPVCSTVPLVTWKTPDRSAPDRSAPDRSAPDRSAPARPGRDGQIRNPGWSQARGRSGGGRPRNMDRRRDTGGRR